jgi:hypothetical protein
LADSSRSAIASALPLTVSVVRPAPARSAMAASTKAFKADSSIQFSIVVAGEAERMYTLFTSLLIAMSPCSASRASISASEDTGNTSTKAMEGIWAEGILPSEPRVAMPLAAAFCARMAAIWSARAFPCRASKTLPGTVVVSTFTTLPTSTKACLSRSRERPYCSWTAGATPLPVPVDGWTSVLNVQSSTVFCVCWFIDWIAGSAMVCSFCQRVFRSLFMYERI